MEKLEDVIVRLVRLIEHCREGEKKYVTSLMLINSKIQSVKEGKLPPALMEELTQAKAVVSNCIFQTEQALETMERELRAKNMGRVWKLALLLSEGSAESSAKPKAN